MDSTLTTPDPNSTAPPPSAVPVQASLAGAKRVVVKRTPKPATRPARQRLAITSDGVARVLAFTVLYVLAVAWGMSLAGADGITAWYPAAGLALAAVTLGGPRWIAAVAFASLVSIPLHPNLTDPAPSVIAALVLAGSYGGAGLVLHRTLDRRRPLARVSDAWWLIGVGVLAGPIIAATLTITELSLLGTLPADASIGSMIRTFVLGDALGIISVAPAIIVAGATVRHEGLVGLLPSRQLRGPESLVALLLLAALTPAVYLGGGSDLRAVAALPLCWLALRFGVTGAVIGSFSWAASAAVLLSLTDSTDQFAGLQAFLLTGMMLAVIIGAVVSERERTQRELRHLAMHDQPSGLPNEPYLIEMLDEALVNARGGEVTTLIIRFAGLRQVAAALSKKDTQQLVASLTRQIAAIAGPGAVVARPGFDRYAVLLTGAGATRRQEIADTLVEQLHQPLAVDSREVFVDPRIGITVGLPGEAADVVLAHAVHAADVAAVADGNRIGYYDASIERAHRDRQELTEDLRIAVEKGEFLLAFQPIVTAKEGTVVAAEALLRWVDKKRGPVSPMDFIPVAEETGLILPIGRWVLNEACERATEWPHVDGRPIDVSVNVSPIQLMDEGFVDDVAHALRRSGLPAHRLRVEITEGIVLEDIERTILRITQLREMGVETMLDDFGTGHSSLAWVQRLPVSCIKIDRAFVSDVAVDGIDRAIVHASLYLSRALGTETVAEGVETEAQREQLVRMGCLKLQGYLFARPQPAAVFPDWLATQRAKAVSRGVVPMQPAPIEAPVHDVHAAAYGARATAPQASPVAQPYAAGARATAGVRPAPMPPATPTHGLTAVGAHHAA